MALAIHKVMLICDYYYYYYYYSLDPLDVECLLLLARSSPPARILSELKDDDGAIYNMIAAFPYYRNTLSVIFPVSLLVNLTNRLISSPTHSFPSFSHSKFLSLIHSYFFSPKRNLISNQETFNLFYVKYCSFSLWFHS